ncbi:MAG: DUF4330 domain-containing protein [Clostridia bacterium]|nr:DUF4330 domain-containing protein [Clostridia bacterium]
MNDNNSATKKAKHKGKFNFIDFLLVLIVLAIIAALVYVFLPSSHIKRVTSDKTLDMQYTIEILGVDEQYISNIVENDTVIDSVTKSNIGTVTAVDYSMQYTELAYDEESSTGVLTPIAGKYNVVVTISATAEYEEGTGYTVNGTRIAVGEKISARFPNYICECYCISVPLD